MTTELQTRPSLTAVEVKAGLDLILQVMQKTMEKGKDYGVIPGCKLPSLWKPGAEKILTAFRIGVDPEVEDLSSEDEARYRVKARLFHEPTGVELGKGIGEASSYEEKYKWRKAVCDEEFNDTPEDRKRIVWKRGQDKPYQVKQVRTNKADVANTVLKMAKKRAQVDGTLTATAASAVFTQDLEDLEKEVREAIVEGENEGTPAPIQPPQPKATNGTTEAKVATQTTPADAKADTGNIVTFVPAARSSKPDKNGKQRWAIKDPDGAWYSTYTEAVGLVMMEAGEGKKSLTLAYTVDGDFKTAVSAKLA